MVQMKEIRAVARRIGRGFRPHKVILFGSYARGTPTPDSDVDLLVVLPFRGTSFRKSLEILNRLDIRFPVDLLARTPADVRTRYKELDPLIRDALDEGKILYDRNRKRMG